MIQLNKQSTTCLQQAKKLVLLKFVFTDRSPQKLLSQLFRKQLNRSQFSTEQKSRVLLASRCILTLLQLLKEQNSMQFRYSQDVMVLVPKTQHRHRSLLYSTTQQKLNSHLVSTMTLQICLLKSVLRLLQLRQEQSTVSSGVLALTVQ